jgi:hypothetical protein
MLKVFSSALLSFWFMPALNYPAFRRTRGLTPFPRKTFSALCRFPTAVVEHDLMNANSEYAGAHIVLSRVAAYHCSVSTPVASAASAASFLPANRKLNLSGLINCQFPGKPSIQTYDSFGTDCHIAI